MKSCSVPLSLPLESVTEIPSSSKASTAVDSPRVASIAVRCIRRMPTSMAAMSVPPIWAAWERAERNSTEAPTRLDILSRASPVDMNCRTDRSMGANRPAPAAKTLVPSDRMPAPQALSFVEAAFRPRTSFESSANSSTNCAAGSDGRGIGHFLVCATAHVTGSTVGTKIRNGRLFDVRLLPDHPGRAQSRRSTNRYFRISMLPLMGLGSGLFFRLR